MLKQLGFLVQFAFFSRYFPRTCTITILYCGYAFSQVPTAVPSHEKWENEIVAIGIRLAKQPPKKGDVLFVGSLMIRLWKLAEVFPDAPDVGFGGSEMRHATFFADRALLPHQPAVIVFPGEDSDLTSQRTQQ